VQTGRIEIRSTDPGIAKPPPDTIDRQIEAAMNAPPEDIEPHEYEAVRELRENMPRPVLEGFETDPSGRRKEKRLLFALGGVVVVGAIIALAIAKASPNRPSVADGAQPTTTLSMALPSVTTSNPRI
jgi:hypothetical protein